MSLVRVARLLLSAACAWALVGAFVQQASVPRTVLFAKGKVGGIYEFAGAARGNQPPAELAEMLGLRVKKPSRKPAKKSPPSAKTPASEGPAGEVKRGRGRPRKDAEPVLSVDDLEKQVLAKYGSNSFKQGVEEDWDDEELEELNLLTKGDKVVRGKFQGFQPSTKLQTEVPKEKGEKGAKAKVIVAEEDEEEEEGQAAKRTSLSERLRLRKSQGTSPTTGLGSARTPSSTPTSSTSSTPTSSGLEGYELDFESERADEGEDYGWDEEDLQYLFGGKGKKTRKMKEVEGGGGEGGGEGGAAPMVRFGPLLAAQGFRLRPPPPVDPLVLARRQQKEAAAREKEAIREARVRASREAAKSQFVPFNFSDAKYEEGARVEEEEGLELQLMSGLRAARDGESEGPGGIQGGQEVPEVQEADLAAEDALEQSARPGQEEVFSSGGFAELGVTDPTVLANLRKMRLYTPTRIQALAVPALLGGANVVLQAQTGSGKTLAFLLPLLAAVDPTKKQVQAIIMAPSRELVTQIGSVAGKLFAGTDYRVVTLIGGANVRNQIKHMREDRPQILVATPGRLAELVFRLEQVKLGNVRAVVVDEVDNMMHEPYVGEIETVLQGTPLYSRGVSAGAGGGGFVLVGDEGREESAEGVETGARRKMLVLASATSSDPAVAAFADRYTGQAGWRQVAVQGAAALPRTITHGLISVPRMRALEMLRKFLRAKPTVKSALVFVNEPHRVEVVCRELGDMGLVAAPLHGDSTKEDRKEIITRMRDGRLKLVVCTELAARGLDLPELTHVVNFELPTDAEHYVHRTGRCGRAGKQGLVMNFANPETKFVIRRFGKKLGIKVQDCEIRDGKVYLKNDGK